MNNSMEKTHNKNDVKNMNVAVYLNTPSWSPFTELHTAVIHDLLSRNNKVTVYILGRSFKSPTWNPFNSWAIHNFSLFRIKSMLEGVDVRVRNIDLKDVSDEVSDTTSNSLEIGVMSSIASATKAQHRDQLNNTWKKVHKNMWQSARKLYNYFKKEIETEKYDYVFMSNGRFGCVKPLLQIARDLDIGYGLYDVKKSLHEIVFVNELLHSIEGNCRKAFEFYETNPEKAKEVAKVFYGKKIRQEETGDPVYTEDQVKGQLPEYLKNADKEVVVVYPTTDDEYKFIGKEWDGYVPDDQVDEIADLAEHLPEDKYLIVVKMHPNQANSAGNVLGRYLDLAKRYKHVRVEHPLATSDTYAILAKSKYVVVFASTIGVEACYAGKPSILIGDTNWVHMDVAHRTKSGKEAADLILNNIGPKPIKGAIIWAYYLSDYKDELKGYERVANGDYLFNGRRIGKSTFHRILQLPAKLRIEISKPGFKFNLAFMIKIKDVAFNIIKGKWAVK